VKPTELRGILQYIPQFRDKVFILAVDGEIVLDDNFPNLLLDVAVLRSLNIKVVLVHGASFAIRQLAARLGETISNADGTGVTDPATMKIALMASNQLTHEILEGLALNGLRAAYSNCIEALPLGIIKGTDYQQTGRVESVDAEMLRALLEKGVVPVIPPLGIDGNGRTYRVNSDAIALETAKALGAVKLIFVTTADGLSLDGKLIRQIQLDDLQETLREHRGRLEPSLQSKAEHAARACAGGVNRVHIINGRVDEGLLAEVFSNEGIGTLIYADEYQAVRRATRRDARMIYTLIQPSVDTGKLVKRTRSAIEKQIGDFFVFEIDNNIVGCVALHAYPEQKKGELACLAVSPSHERRGIGSKLTAYVEERAKELNLETLVCLSTQAFTFFEQRGYRAGTLADLPSSCRERYEQNCRNSKILVKPLVSASAHAEPTAAAATTRP
jgi:amino-acid N-acetyltransferase